MCFDFCYIQNKFGFVFPRLESKPFILGAFAPRPALPPVRGMMREFLFGLYKFISFIIHDDEELTSTRFLSGGYSINMAEVKKLILHVMIRKPRCVNIIRAILLEAFTCSS